MSTNENAGQPMAEITTKTQTGEEARAIPVEAFPVFPTVQDGPNAKIRYGERRTLNLRPGSYESTTICLEVEILVAQDSETLRAAQSALGAHVHKSVDKIEVALRRAAAANPVPVPTRGNNRGWGG